jgi:hypothetical protein
MTNGTTQYTVENGGNSDSFYFDDGSNIVSGYFYVFNHAGSENEYVSDLMVGDAPPGVVTVANDTTNLTVTPAASGWSTFGDTEDNGDGSFRLNGNPGAVNDFVRTDDEWSRPAFASATFDGGWDSYYPLIEFVGSPGKESAILDIGGYSNYKPSASNMNF